MMIRKKLYSLCIIAAVAVIAEASTANSRASRAVEGKREIVRKSEADPKEMLKEEAASRAGQGCYMGDLRYFEGQFMPAAGGPCEACYCLRGEAQCTERRCKPPVKGCVPVMKEGVCCPVRYDCDQKISLDKLPSGVVDVENYTPNQNDVGSELHFDLNDIDVGHLENHVRIERQSELDPKEENEVTDYPEVEELERTTIMTDIDIDSNASPTENEVNGDTLKATEAPVSEVNTKEDKIGISNDSEIKEPAELNIKEDQLTTTIEEPRITESPIEMIEKQSKAKESEKTDGNELVENLATPPVTSISDIAPEVGAAEETTTTTAFLSIKDLLQKLRENAAKNNESLIGMLPDPITGAHVEDVESPDKLLPLDGDDKEPDFLSYDINVGTSLMTGNVDEKPVGVGQVIPVDIGLPVSRPIGVAPSQPAKEETEPEASFLDSFLNLFTGGVSKKEEVEEPPLLPPPPPFRVNAPPALGLRPPPSIPEATIEEKIDSEIQNEVDSELDLEAKPTIENEVRTRPRLPTTGSVTRNELPIRRRPSIGGARPLRPGLFASRPNFPISNPSVLRGAKPATDDAPDLPSDPVIEVGFKAIRPTSNDTVTEEVFVSEEPTLPPSLPNLQIIPFVAADALVNQEAPDGKIGPGFTPRPFGNLASQDCREGGKVWKNGETVAKGDNDPCVLCRCLNGKVICQRQECPNVPEGCTKETTPEEGECCPKITCDKSANVSIVDTLPSFRPIEDEEEEEEPSPPIRPSPFAHLNRRPPFAPASNRQRLPKPLSTSLRKPSILPSRSKTTKSPASPPTTEEEPETTPSPPPPPPKNEREPTETVIKRRPIRPVLTRAPPPRPLKKSPSPPPVGDRPRPYSSLIRSGTRRPFIPPRLQATTKRPYVSPSETSAAEIVSSTSTTTTAPTISTTEKPTTPNFDLAPTEPEIFQTTPKAEVFSPLLSILQTSPEEQFETTTKRKEKTKEVPQNFFQNIFKDLISNEESSLPDPIHTRPTFEEIDPPAFSPSALDVPTGFTARPVVSEKPFILPPGLLLPEPLAPNNQEVSEGDIINFVSQDKFRAPQNGAFPAGLFNRPAPTVSNRIQEQPIKPLPEIPDEVKAQLPLGNDPILVSGLLELGGCNVYGRMFEIGERIQEISGQCKACQCTKVGVQCLPIC